MEYDEENKKTVIHYGGGCKKGAHPINMPAPSPYKEAKVLQRIVEEVNGSDAFRLSDFKVEDEKNPYQTLSEYHGALSVNDADNLKNCWSSVIRQLMSENEEMVTTAEPWQLFILTLQRGIATGAILLANEKKEYETAGGKFIGYEHQDNDSTEYVLDSTRVFSFVKHQLQELGKDFVTEPSNIFKDLFKNKISSGYSNKDGSGHIRQRYLKRVRLHGHQVEMLVISKEKMEKVIVELEEAKS